MSTLASSFTIVILKPEIASDEYNFAFPELDTPAGREDTSDLDEATQAVEPLRSTIPGVPAVEAALLYPSGQILASIFTRIARAGLRVREKRVVQLTKSQVRALFSYERKRLKDEKTFNDFVNSFARSLSLALLLEYPASLSADEAITRCKQVIGRDDPVAARQDALSASLPHDEWPLRALCGLDSVRSGIVCSATLDCFYRERALLFAVADPYQCHSLEHAIIILLPSFLEALPNGKALLISRLNAGGVLVSKTLDGFQFASLKELALLEKELHPVTGDQHREQFAESLREHVMGNARASVLLEVEALDLATKLRGVLGPASLQAAQLYFPYSVRAQLPRSLAPALEHVRTVENDATCLETGLFVTYEHQTIRTLLECASSGLNSEQIEHTFAIIKPGAASDSAAVREIQAAIRAFGFKIEKERRLRLSRAQAATFYGEHRGKAFFERLLAFMTSGELVAMQLARKDAIRTWRGLMGPTNALVARETHPWTLRARFGADGTRNATHGSDAASSAKRELQFFFGGGLLAFASDEVVGGGGGSARTSVKSVAQRALPSPYAPTDTLETVLTRALDEMLSFKLASQQDACSWLGSWLLEFARSQQERQRDEHELPPPVKPKSATLHSKPKPHAHGGSRELKDVLLDSKHVLVVIAFASDVSAQQRTAVGDALRSLATPRFAHVDVAATLTASSDLKTAVDALGKQVRDAGRRRVVLLDVDIRSSAVVRSFSDQLELRIAYAITIGCAPPSRLSARSELDSRVPHAYFHLQQRAVDAAPSSNFQEFFSPIFRPSLVVVHDTKALVGVATWRSVAQHLGFALLVFDDLVRARAAKERDPNGPFSQLERTGARVPRELLLSLVSDAVHRFQPTSASDDAALGCAQRYLLCGFPFADVLPREFEETVGPIYRLIRVASDKKSEGAWLSHLRKRGAVSDLQLDDPNAFDIGREVRAACALSIGPTVGFCFASTGELLDRVQSLALAQGFVLLDINVAADGSRKQAEDAVGCLKRVLFRASGSSHERFLVCGFPASPDAMREFIETAVVPRFAVLSGASPELQRLASVLDEYPQIAQVNHSAAALKTSRLQSVMFGKRVSFAVGDSSDLDTCRLYSALTTLGYCVVDLRPQQLPEHGARSSDDQVSSLVAQVRATATPRCLVIGAPEHAAFVRVASYYRVLQLVRLTTDVYCSSTRWRRLSGAALSTRSWCSSGWSAMHHRHRHEPPSATTTTTATRTTKRSSSDSASSSSSTALRCRRTWRSC